MQYFEAGNADAAVKKMERHLMSMVVGRQRNRAQGFLSDAVLMHVTLHPHGKVLRRRKHAVRHQIGFFAQDGVDTGGLPEATILALSQ